MIQEKELVQIPKCLNETELVPLEIWQIIDLRMIEAGIGGMVRNGEDSIFFEIEIKYDKVIDGYSLDGYSARLLHIGEIKHENVKGIDTAVIENTMRKIDWQKVTPEKLRDEPAAVIILDRLMELHATDDQRGMDIAMLLAMKYFAGTHLGQVFDFSEARKNYETTLFIELNGNRHDLSLPEAYQLLCGRGVAKSITPDGSSDTLCWMAMDKGKVVKTDDFDVIKYLSRLPFDKPRTVVQLAEDIAALSAGNQQLGRFRIDNKVFHAYYEPDPLNGNIALRDLKQNKISLSDLKMTPELISNLPRKKPEQSKGLGL
ncbi:MAG: hypothetical protein BGO31_05525 [Bacteroidetes bacterium 43-16]|uniref:hypothetical protein n=1 Tax=uncultured Dysgonomonas sp. TaxID=206096 RepID=UPI000928402E|nr:hypothetical protein [uncultured Dysgonomonas sp.]OJV52291.1 MAG: hypothetical protein BGO31_05525 [Bacteroidetes bacterium 43-16]